MGHSLVSFVENGFHARQHTACAFLDLKSAFDTAWFPAILNALNKRLCPPYLIRLVRDFLQNRPASLSHGGAGINVNINLGCPQGGVLSPFLWIVMLDDLPRFSFPFPYRSIAYADDLTIVTSHKDPSIATRNLQQIYDTVIAWCRAHKLSLNALKTVFMLFSRNQLDIFTTYISINGDLIHTSKEATFLGFLLDPQLK